MAAAELAGTHAPTAGDYIQHHLHHLQKDFAFNDVVQHKIVDFSLYNLDSLIFSVVLGAIACFFMWRAARKATSGVPGRFQAAVEKPQAGFPSRINSVRLDFPDERHGHVAGGWPARIVGPFSGLYRQ